MPVGGADFLFSGHFRSFPVIGVNMEDLGWVEEGDFWALSPLGLLSGIDMDFMLEKGHKTWQGATVIKMECGH